MLEERPRLVYVVTVPGTARILLKGQAGFMRQKGYDVTVIASPGAELDKVAEREKVRTIGVPMEREIAPREDAQALLALVRVFSELKPHIVNASTPKAGLLGSIAARMTSVPVRIYLLRGLRLETTSGVKRQILGATERLASASATDVIAVSDSLRSVYSRGRYCAKSKLRVLGNGSSNGVDVGAFERTPARMKRALELRRQLGIAPDTTVVGFLGRPVAEKGMGELLRAFEQLRPRKIAMLIVGGSLAGDDMDPATQAKAKSLGNVFVLPSVEDPADYLAAFDLLAFPSYREGFPNVPLEAAASGVPTVGFRVTGVVDAIVDGKTGVLVAPRDVEAFSAAIARYTDDPSLRALHGQHARARAIEHFSNERVWRLWFDEYARLSHRYGVPAPTGASEMMA